jgi:hypothetical protein
MLLEFSLWMYMMVHFGDVVDWPGHSSGFRLDAMAGSVASNQLVL